MAAISFFGDLVQSISERGRGLIGLGRGEAPALERGAPGDLVKLCADLISRRGEASGVALARLILDGYAALPIPERLAFLTRVAAEFDADRDAVADAIGDYLERPTRATLGALHEAAEPKSQELIRRLNLARGGTFALVRMREDLFALREALRAAPRAPDAPAGLDEAVASLDADFEHLFSSWFNRGFLVLRPIDWTTPAHILEKIIRYEAVHAIRDWDDLRRRIEPADRRCFAFFHPALLDEPLIFVEVALTDAIPGAIAPILATDRAALAAREATTAVFYSISNCQRGLAGVSFGNFLIKQVVEDLAREIPSLKQFVTLSPAPGFARWLERERGGDGAGGRNGAILPRELVDALRPLDEPGWHLDPARAEGLRRALVSAAAAYFLRAKAPNGRPADPVARFHLGNGARLERIDHLGDVSPKGLRQSQGVMVNYLYDLSAIEKNHEAYANQSTVIASPTVLRELKAVDAPARAALAEA